MSDGPDFAHRVLPVLEDAASEIQTRAKRLMNRESTDFLGRISEAWCAADTAAEENDMEEFRENMLELAALAMAQAAMSAVPGMTIEK